MQVAHLGVAAFIVGVTLVTGYQSEQDVKMQVGDVVHAGGYEFQFNGITEVTGPNYAGARAEMIVSRNGVEKERMYPEKRNYNATGNVMTETAIDAGIFRHLYISLGEVHGNQHAIVRIWWKPYVTLIWIGAMIMAVGGILSLFDRRLRFGVPAVRRRHIIQQPSFEDAE